MYNCLAIIFPKFRKILDGLLDNWKIEEIKCNIKNFVKLCNMLDTAIEKMYWEIKDFIDKLSFQTPSSKHSIKNDNISTIKYSDEKRLARNFEEVKIDECNSTTSVLSSEFCDLEELKMNREEEKVVTIGNNIKSCLKTSRLKVSSKPFTKKSEQQSFSEYEYECKVEALNKINEFRKSKQLELIDMKSLSDLKTIHTYLQDALSHKECQDFEIKRSLYIRGSIVNDFQYGYEALISLSKFMKNPQILYFVQWVDIQIDNEFDNTKKLIIMLTKYSDNSK